jgi:hypothetical protein
MISGADFLTEARVLLADASSEIRRRSGVSRAYFACFHHLLVHPQASAVVEAVDDTLQSAPIKNCYTSGRHVLLVKGLLKSGDRDLIYLASRLHELLGHRMHADYRVSSPLGENVARVALSAAESIFADLPAN